MRLEPEASSHCYSAADEPALCFTSSEMAAASSQGGQFPATHADHLHHSLAAGLRHNRSGRIREVPQGLPEPVGWRHWESMIDRDPRTLTSGCNSDPFFRKGRSDTSAAASRTSTCETAETGVCPLRMRGDRCIWATAPTSPNVLPRAMFACTMCVPVFFSFFFAFVLVFSQRSHGCNRERCRHARCPPPPPPDAGRNDRCQNWARRATSADPVPLPRARSPGRSLSKGQIARAANRTSAQASLDLLAELLGGQEPQPSPKPGSRAPVCASSSPSSSSPPHHDHCCHF